MQPSWRSQGTQSSCAGVNMRSPNKCECAILANHMPGSPLRAYPGEQPVLDAQLIPRSALALPGRDDGAFQIESIAYVRVTNVKLINSHKAGFTIRDSSNIELINNATSYRRILVTSEVRRQRLELAI